MVSWYHFIPCCGNCKIMCGTTPFVQQKQSTRIVHLCDILASNAMQGKRDCIAAKIYFYAKAASTSADLISASISKYSLSWQEIKAVFWYQHTSVGNDPSQNTCTYCFLCRLRGRNTLGCTTALLTSNDMCPLSRKEAILSHQHIP